MGITSFHEKYENEFVFMHDGLRIVKKNKGRFLFVNIFLKFCFDCCSKLSTPNQLGPGHGNLFARHEGLGDPHSPRWITPFPILRAIIKKKRDLTSHGYSRVRGMYHASRWLHYIKTRFFLGTLALQKGGPGESFPKGNIRDAEVA